MNDESASILRELGEIKAGLEHAREDLHEIKQDMKEIRQDNENLSARVTDCERWQSEEEGKQKTAIRTVSVFVAFVSAVISSLFAWLFGKM